MGPQRITSTPTVDSTGLIFDIFVACAHPVSVTTVSSPSLANFPSGVVGSDITICEVQ